jgi:hypothetical protein
MTHISPTTKRIIPVIVGLALAIASLICMILSMVFYNTSYNLFLDFSALAWAFMFISPLIMMLSDDPDP